MAALGKEGDCKWMCRNKEAAVEAKENGTETRLVPKKDCNYRGINSFVKPNFYHSFTYFCSFINPRTELLFSSTGQLSSCHRENIPKQQTFQGISMKAFM